MAQLSTQQHPPSLVVPSPEPPHYTHADELVTPISLDKAGIKVLTWS